MKIVIPLLLLLLLLGPGLKWVFRLMSGGARKAALQKGFTITEVERAEVPMFNGDGTIESLVKEKGARYALARDGKTGTTWELLQRDKNYGAQLPNDYLVRAPEVTPRLLEALKPIAEEFSDEYFEFEGTLADVAVYWGEWGGEKQVERLHRALMSLRGV